jgi:DNA polymerase-3 subunit epsilon
MDFITIDFETASAERHSPCELGLTFVKDGIIIGTKSWLIKPMCYPYFNHWNVAVHGIRPSDVRDKPEFHQVWKEILPLIENKFLIAHNASFDFSVLRATLEAYRIPYPSIYYACSVIFSKKVWEGLPAYDLKTLCNFNQITFKHHRAAADSRATAELTLKAFEKIGTPSLENFHEKFKTTVGQLFEGGYIPSKAKKISKSKKPTEFI